jgi:hypothetical protein
MLAVMVKLSGHLGIKNGQTIDECVGRQMDRCKKREIINRKRHTNGKTDSQKERKKDE